MKIKVLLADEQKLFRDGLHLLIDKQLGFDVVGTAENAEIAVRLARQLTPNIVIMNIEKPIYERILAAQKIISKDPQIKVVALSRYSNSQVVEGMLKAGVSAYVLKDCSIEELCHAMRTVYDNQTYYSQEVASTVVNSYLGKDKKYNPIKILSKREVQVLQLIGDGKKTKDIATILKVSVKTIETHRRKMMKKLQVKSIAELVKLSIREGIVNLDS